MEILPPSLPVVMSPSMDGPTLSDLIRAYKSDPDSNYCKPDKLSFATRQNYANLMARIERDYGHLALAEIDLRQILRMHEAWVGPEGHIPMAHGLIGMLRTLLTFGSALMRSTHCRELKAVLHDHRFEMGKPRKKILTTEQAIAVIRHAHLQGLHSIALAQSIQTSGILRQKDVIGETLPATETKGILQSDGSRWHKGVTWDEMDDNFVLRHNTSKKGKPIVLDLKKAPLVMAEMRWLAENRAIERTGPMVVFEKTGLPYRSFQYRKEWRCVARAAGIPDDVFNMDTRAGQITVAIQLGAPLTSVSKAATHSTVQMTQRYSRDHEAAADEVLETRAELHERLLATA